MFRANVTVTAIVFVLIAPTIHIYAHWIPDKKDSLWLIPLRVIGISACIWFLANLFLPLLIQWGIFDDRRTRPRDLLPLPAVRLIRITAPVLVFIVHMALLVAISWGLVTFMKGGHIQNWLLNIP